MRKKLIGLFAAVLLFVGGVQAQENTIEVLPKPEKITKFQDEIVLSGETAVYLDPKAGLNQEYVTEVLTEAGFQPVYVTKAKKAAIVFQLNEVPSLGNDEAYGLYVKAPGNRREQIVAKADTRFGLLYALQRLRQPTSVGSGGVTVPSCIIADQPTFSWRAYMQDESRHF